MIIASGLGRHLRPTDDVPLLSYEYRNISGPDLKGAREAPGLHLMSFFASKYKTYYKIFKMDLNHNLKKNVPKMTDIVINL